MSVTIYPVIGREKSLPFYLSGIGISDPEYHVRRESGLISHQLLYTKKGSGILIIKGNRIQLNTDSLLYLPPAIPHEYFPENGCWETHWLVFRGEYAKQLLENMGLKDVMFKSLDNSENLRRIFGKILAAADHTLGGGKCAQWLYEYLLEAKKVLTEEICTYHGGIIENSLEFIEENFSRDITLEELSQHSGVSSQHYCRLFRNTMGMRPMEYISKKRLAHAKLLLETSEMSIGEISQSVGYSSLTYFGMVFKKYEGISPSEFRRHEKH